MIRILIIFSLLFLTEAIAQEKKPLKEVEQKEDCPLAGSWRSNEKMTLANMEKVQLTETQRELLTSNFFGKLVHKTTDCKTFSTTYEGETSTGKITKLKKEGNTITIYTIDDKIGKESHFVIFLHKDGQCYSTMPIDNLGFREVFCKESE